MSTEIDIRETAERTLEEYLASSCIPKELWTNITKWLGDTQLADMYLAPEDAIGAWWGAQEAEKMGYLINFGKSCCIPSHWCPTGDDWKMAQANAKLGFVGDWQTLIDNDALIKIEN
ncbi:hypothetical protein RVY78_05370 [Veillonella sp. YH-vei2232]|jgi:hypothetical protein|uniref:DUF2750 domain-containing protein n=1 Tax=Veillonella absiana TaxID=3079305 RepID=A0ABU3Z5Z9_9FIRM|nr:MULTISPECIES: hypothetical protein [unclassified Veillonella]NCB95393.1 hypothetical protein [Negativicutes bacterium]MBK7921121.1 hypothetical protein [Veillonella sp.]MBP6922904.1 hypothetical protein [Veillonella sp.]MBP8617425.1 hypothetical protein [Veillonella sp.]MBP9516664.1 hypothetical protein [Veillonella sp.]